jgi:mannose-6-phosphate isomerase-like protein (cupin superfamily)
MDVSVKDITKDFVVISPEKNASIETANTDLYQRLEQNYNGFKSHELVAAYEFSADWASWEVHPHGDEVVLLLFGEITFLLKLPSGDTSVTLNKAGTYAIIPKGVWHTAKTHVKSKLLFITPGEGTLNTAEPQ